MVLTFVLPNTLLFLNGFKIFFFFLNFYLNIFSENIFVFMLVTLTKFFTKYTQTNYNIFRISIAVKLLLIKIINF